MFKAQFLSEIPGICVRGNIRIMDCFNVLWNKLMIFWCKDEVHSSKSF